MKVLAALLFLFGLLVLCFTIFIYFQFAKMTVSTSETQSVVVEQAMNWLAPIPEGTKEVDAAKHASKFTNRLSMVGMAGAVVCVIASFIFSTAKKDRRNADRE